MTDILTGILKRLALVEDYLWKKKTYPTPSGGTAGGSGDHIHGLGHWNTTNVTTFDMVDLAEYIEWVSDNGTMVDPLTYSLSADASQIVFDSAVTAGHVLLAEYVIARI